MKQFVLGRASKEYIIKVAEWAKRLEVEEMTIHRDLSVTLGCRDGNICNHYKPSPQELRRRER